MCAWTYKKGYRLWAIYRPDGVFYTFVLYKKGAVALCALLNAVDPKGEAAC